MAEPAREARDTTGGGDSTFTVIVAALASSGHRHRQGGGRRAQRVQRDAVGGRALGRRHRHRGTAADLTQTQHPPRRRGPPLGHGPERYIWALLAAVATFVGGAVFALYDGVHSLTHGEEPGDPLVAYLVLAVAFLLEGYSLRTGLKQAHGEARRYKVPFGRYLRRTPRHRREGRRHGGLRRPRRPAAGAGGLLGGQLTGSGVWDGVASLCIGVLLLYVAWVLGRSNAEFLIGRPLPRTVRDRIRRNSWPSNTSRPYWS